MTDKILLKPDPQTKARPCDFSTAAYGPNGYVSIKTQQGDYIMLVAKPELLAELFTHLATKFGAGSVAQQDAKTKELIPQDPYQAWPWLVQRFPRLFDGIDLSHEPYASYLSRGHLGQDQTPADISAIRPYRDQILNDQGQAIRGSQAFVAKMIFGDEALTGGSYRRRILAAIAGLKNTTTTTPESAEVDQDRAQAA